MRPEIIRVLRTGKMVGKGVEGSPIRNVVQYWEITESNELHFLVEYDPDTGEWHDVDRTPHEYAERDGVGRKP